MTVCWNSHHTRADNLSEGRLTSQPSGRDDVLSYAFSPNRLFALLATICLALVANPYAAAGWSPGPAFLRSLSVGQTVLQPVQASPATFRFRDVSGPAGQAIPLSIEIEGPDDGESGRLFIFSGIPEGVKLTPGGYFGQFWAVNSKVFNELTLSAPPDFHGSFIIKVTQTGTSPDDANRSSTFTATIIGPENQTATQAVAATSSDAAPQSTAVIPSEPRTQDLPNLKDLTLMTRATELFSNGDISGARSVFEYLAARGNAQAAIALGGTYDPIVLEELYIRGLDPDPEIALKWYKRAEELGSPEARSRLDALASR